MGTCVNQKGDPKRRHETKELAEEHLAEVQPFRIHLMNCYRCPVCRYWHVGRVPGTKRQKWSARQIRKHEELMVGRLIGILRGTYPGPERKRKRYDIQREVPRTEREPDQANAVGSNQNTQRLEVPSR